MNIQLIKSILNVFDYTEEINKKDFFIRKGQLNHKLGIIRKGVLRGFVTDENGNEINLLLYQENEIISGNLVPDIPSSINIQAIENCIIEVANFSNAFSIIKKDENLNHIFIENVDKLHSKIQSRTISFIKYNSLDRYQYFLKEYSNLINRIPNYYIASFLGITPTQLSRIRKSFANK